MTTPTRPSGEKQHAPATERNREPLRAVLTRQLPATGTVLEIAAGTGQHACYFAEAFPDLTWQPTDADPDALVSIAAWVADHPHANLRAPLLLDVTAEPWPVTAADAIVCINMVHISPWQATEALMRGAGRLLPTGAPLVLYGPYKRGGAHTAPSNEAFEQWLKARDPRFGVRDLEAVVAEAEKNGLALADIFEMPANNLTVVFRKG